MLKVKGEEGVMVELRTIDTLTLVLELESRDGVKSTYVTEEEFSKI